MPPPSGAFVMRNATVTIETVEYANQCTRALLTPDAPTSTLRTLVPDGIKQDVDTNVWTLALTIVQDNSAAGLAGILRTMHGQEIDVELTPKNGNVAAGGSGKMTCTVVAKAVPFGGSQGEWTTAEIELPVQGQPVYVPPTA